ncbi:SAM-dependent methyltransferase [Actinomadura atramentaria]|uniref:SAM-dependent methyltransferase n=1 Tax=Actinomadura atramentaria TaxID=1990 RepID=UPI00037453FF|nr:SAM-dependent methyltransferase [Actinomadura atramentaria]
MANQDLRTDTAQNARVWNYWLGGKDNFPADRAVGDRIYGIYPSIVQVARADRAFLGRAVRFLAGERGVRQFLDLGTGLPTADNTHEVAQRTAPDSRVLYVDNDPLVLRQARMLLTSTPEGSTDYMEADVRDTEAILARARRTLELDQPVAVMLLGILNFLLDDAEARAVVDELVAAVPSGSYVALTHPTLELGGDANADAMEFFNSNAEPPIRTRTGEQIAYLLRDLELEEPGLVSCARWRPGRTRDGAEPPLVAQYAAVARKP